MLRRAACNELSWPSGLLGCITTLADLGTHGKMRFGFEASTTRLRPKKEQFSTAISIAAFRPKGANAFGNGSACELPAAKIIGMIFSRLRIRRRRQNSRTQPQTPAPSVTFCTRHLERTLPRCLNSANDFWSKYVRLSIDRLPGVNCRE